MVLIDERRRARGMLEQHGQRLCEELARMDAVELAQSVGGELELVCPAGTKKGVTM